MVKLLAATPPNVIEMAPVKFNPVIFTVLPVPALVGVNEYTLTGG